MGRDDEGNKQLYKRSMETNYTTKPQRKATPRAIREPKDGVVAVAEEVDPPFPEEACWLHFKAVLLL